VIEMTANSKNHTEVTLTPEERAIREKRVYLAEIDRREQRVAVKAGDARRARTRNDWTDWVWLIVGIVVLVLSFLFQGFIALGEGNIQPGTGLSQGALTLWFWVVPGVGYAIGLVLTMCGLWGIVRHRRSARQHRLSRQGAFA
jgi:hypothetical protein